MLSLNMKPLVQSRVIAITLQCMLSLNMKPLVQSMAGLQVYLTIIREISFGMKKQSVKQ